MITDPLFFRLFETSPETFFLLLGMPAESAAAMAAPYQSGWYQVVHRYLLSMLTCQLRLFK
jgi:hypothetical protein